MKVSTVDEMRALDRGAIREYAIPDLILMENAGEAVYYAILREFGLAGRRFVVLCGVGNNGGDGLVVARKINSSGGSVGTFVFGDPGRYGESARVHYEMLAASGSEIVVEPSLEMVHEALGRCDVAVDGLFGTGITREVGGVYRDVIEAVNRCGVSVVAIDIPSGVDGDTGQVRGLAVRADYTVTFGLPKRGNMLYPGAGLGGHLFVTHISFPPKHYGTADIAVSLNDPPPLPERRIDGHKGSFGDALFVAGAAGYFGAPAFAALAMLKAGGGYARLATPRSLAPALAAIASEVVFAPQAETAAGTLARDARDAILELSEKVDFVVLGPGLSLDEESQHLARELVAAITKPLLIDGDGLTAVAADPALVGRRAAPTILTPHVGEMSGLAGRSMAEVTADPVTAAQDAAAELDAIVVLKGAHSLIAHPDRRVLINTSGNSGMASAGSGDVLTGTVAAMHGLGLALEDAVSTGVFLHGAAGDLAAAEHGEDGVTARDILDHLPATVRAFRDQYEDFTRDYYGVVEVI